MQRKGHTQKNVLADPLYNNKVVTKLINNIMLDGKKGVARRSYTAHLPELRKKPVNRQLKYLRKL